MVVKELTVTSEGRKEIIKTHIIHSNGRSDVNNVIRRCRFAPKIVFFYLCSLGFWFE